MRAILRKIVEEVTTVLSKVDEREALALSEQLRKAARVFVCGEGRSGLMAKAFAMRLMHGGYPVYVVGETITPNIGEGDLLVAISGSGSTGMILQYVSKAKEAGAKVFLITTNRESKIAEKSDWILAVPAATKYRRPGEPETIQPLGNQFDQSVHLLLDAVLIHSLQEGEVSALHEAMRNRHANLE